MDISIDEGEFAAIIGTSGSGKTTLLNIIGGLDRDYRGTAEVAGNDLAKLSDGKLARFRNRSIGFVFQHFHLLDHLTVAENIMLPNTFAARGTQVAEPEARARELLEDLGLGHKFGERPNHLSGGEKQRVAIARALFFKPKLLLCDEPTGSLDPERGQQIIDTLSQFHQQGYTVVIITHEMEVSQATQRVIRMGAGKVIDDGRRSAS